MNNSKKIHISFLETFSELTQYGFGIDNGGYQFKGFKDRIVVSNLSDKFRNNTDFATPGMPVFTQGTIGRNSKNGIIDYVFVSPYSNRDRVNFAGGYDSQGVSVKSIYCHKDAIQKCPNFLPDDSVLEILEVGENEHGTFVKSAKIVWVRPL